jgi:hypothetical protein
VVGKIYLKSAASVVCQRCNFWNLRALEVAEVSQNNVEDGFSLLPRTRPESVPGFRIYYTAPSRAFMASKYARLLTASADAAVVPALRRILKVD